MRNRILIASLFVFIMLFISMASVMGISNFNNDIEDEYQPEECNLEPREFKRVFVWSSDLDGGYIDWHNEISGAYFKFEWTGTLNVLELFPFKYQQINAGLNGEFKGFYGIAYARYFYPDTPNIIFGYARLLLLY